MELAYAQVREWILNGEVHPGEVLDQGVLAAAVGVSTTPMREALRRLEAEDLLSINAHRRVVVSPLSLRELDEIYAVRFELDPLAARLASGRADDALLDELASVIEAEPPGEIKERLALNRRFHAGIYRASGNEVLVRILDSLHDRSTRYRLLLVASDEDVEVAYREHREILDALRCADGEALAKLTRLHLEASRATMAVAVAGDQP